MTPHEQGYTQVMSYLGLSKEAGAGAFFAKKVLPRLKRWGTTARGIAVGSPIKATKELMSGKGFSKGSLIRQGFHPGKGKMGLAMGGLYYGVPAYQAYQLSQSDDPNKVKQIGSLLGGTVAGLGTWKAYGLLGSMLASSVGSRVGGALGDLGQRAVTGEPKTQESYSSEIPNPGLLAARQVGRLRPTQF